MGDQHRVHHHVCHALRRQDPGRSHAKPRLRAGPGAQRIVPSGEHARADFSLSQRLVIATFIISLGILVYGILQYKWFINEIAGLFLGLGIVCGILGRLSPDEFTDSFKAGARDMMGVAFIIGCARALLIIANDGKVMDTLLHGLAALIANLHPILAAQVMFFTHGVINFFVHSGSGQAALTMPIMAPLADVVGISRQTAVLAFQFGDGWINPILPTSGVTMGVLGLAGISWEKWFKWMLPVQIYFLVLAFGAAYTALSVPLSLTGGMMKRSITACFLAAVLLLPTLALAQKNVYGGTGGVRFKVNRAGSFALYDKDFTTQLDRASIIVALDSAHVFDYQEDANYLTSSPILSSVGKADTVATALFDNSWVLPSPPPDVQVVENAYAWKKDSIVLVDYALTNTSAAPYAVHVGMGCVPAPSETYGGETVAYDTTAKMAYFFREGEAPYIGVKLLGQNPTSFHVLDWDAYSPADPSSDAATDSTRWRMTALPGFRCSARRGGEWFLLQPQLWHPDPWQPILGLVHAGVPVQHEPCRPPEDERLGGTCDMPR